MLKKGSKGNDVRQLQIRLAALGYITAADGIYGNGTKQVVIEFQCDNNLVPDGVAGPITLATLNIAKPKAYSVMHPKSYITIVKIRKDRIKKADVVNSIGSFETVKSMYNRVKPTFIINGILFGMVNGVSLSKFIDEGKLIAKGIYTNYCFMITQDGKILMDQYQDRLKLRDAAGFSPSLVVNGKILIDDTGLKTDKSFMNNRHPRTAIGMNDDYIFLVAIDGRRWWAPGMTIKELANYMFSLGCKEAGNMDGGDSTIILGPEGKALNSPRIHRAVDNSIAFYVG